MSSRKPPAGGSADVGPAIAIVMREQNCDVDTAARHLKDEAARLGVSIAAVAASIVVADLSRTGGEEPPPSSGPADDAENG